MTEQRYFVPWAQAEQIDVAASTYFKNSSPSLWKNNLDQPIHVTHLLVDSNSVTTASIKVGKQGRSRIVDSYVSTLALHNIERLSNQATDSAAPLWKFDKRYPVIVSPQQIFQVEMTDLAGAIRYVNVQFHGYRLCDPSEPVVLAERVTLASLGNITALVKTDPKSPIIITDFGFYCEETGTAALLRGLKTRVTEGGLPPWMNMFIRGTVLFPNRQGGAAILELAPDDLLIQPGEVLEFEVIDTSAAAVTVYVGAVGYTEDRRSR
ncbi:MAG: hypothetical protein M0R22_00205 [Dehalococcoidia bacterium]|jgi:hypothetical protein|nr:hypothetical protein [Dehalococcoidia bacterium]